VQASTDSSNVRSPLREEQRAHPKGVADWVSIRARIALALLDHHSDSALTFDEISIFINTLASPEQDLNFFHLTYRKRTKIESLNILLNLCKSPEAGNGQRAFTPGPNPG